MKKIAVYGAGNKSKNVDKVIARYMPDVECCYAIENKQLEKIGTHMQADSATDRQMEVITLKTCAELYQKKEIEGIVFPTSYHIFDWNEIYGLCTSYGVKAEDIYAVPIDILRKNNLDDGDRDRILTPYQELGQLYHLDIHIVDNCNLKCKGCAHFSPLADEGTCIVKEDYQKDLSQLKKLIPNICSIALLGGEPLLHPELEHIMQVTREIYPYAHIRVVTNGILLPKLSEECLQMMRQSKIAVGISMYPPFLKMENQWKGILEKHGIEYKISECSQFERRLWDKPVFDGKLMTKKCGHVLCMRGHSISRCPMVAFIDYYNKFFGKRFPDNGKIDIYSVDSGKRLKERLENPSGLCDYCCARDQCLEQWEYCDVKTMKASDWFMTNIDNLKIEGGQIL